MKKQLLTRVLFYLAGLLILAFGITGNTKTGFGVSPIVSVPYSIAGAAGFNFGNMTFLAYTIFALIEMAVHTRICRKQRTAGRTFLLWKILLLDFLQIPLSLVFSRFINLFSSVLPDLTADCQGTFFGSAAGRFLVLFLSIFCTGAGAALSLEMRLIPNPGDGVVQSFSDLSGRSVGFVKNCFDGACIAAALAIGLLSSGHVIGIGPGTLLAVLGVGRVISLWNHLFRKRIRKAAGLEL